MGFLPRLVIIGPTPPPAHGVSIAMALLLDSRLRQEFDVCHIDTSDRRGISKVENPDAYDAYLFLKSLACLSSALMTKRYPIVYLAISQSAIGFIRDSVFIILSHMAGSRIVVHLHGGNLQEWYRTQRRAFRSYIRFVFSLISRIIVLGETFRGLVSDLVAEQRVAIIPNGINWDTKVEGEQWPKTRKYRILHLGTLSRKKGTLVFLKAAALVAKRRSDVDFILAGPWYRASEEAEAMDLIKMHSLEDTVFCIGVVDHKIKQAVLRSADVFVFSGIQQEGQPLVIIEAMAAALPVLYTNRGCIRETVNNDECGIEIELDNPSSLADSIEWLLDHPDKRYALGARARSRFEKLYTGSHFIDNMCALFEKMAKEKK